MPKMTRTETELKGLMRKGIRVKQNHPALSILAAMRVVNFMDEVDEDCTLQQEVSRLVSPPTKQINNYLQWWYFIIEEYGGLSR
jgi:hypothetical protein